MSTSMRIALFGDGCIARLAQFCSEDLKIPGEVRFFGTEEMTASHYDTDLLNELLAFEPNVVLLSIGGNDLNSTSKPSSVYQKIASLGEFLKENGVSTVYVVKLCERGLFETDSEMTKRSFNAQRRKINTLLDKNNELCTVDLNMRFPRDYDVDKVHFSQSRGLQRCFFNIRRVFFQHKFV